MFINKINKKTFFTLLLLSLGTHQTLAAQDTTTSASMQVTLEVLKSCSFRADKMDFGQHGSDEGKGISASSTLYVNCTKNTPFSITTASSDLSMQPVNGEGDKVNFELYTDQNDSSPVTNTSALSGTGTGEAQMLTLWGKVPAAELAKASAGKYQANITLNMLY
ncbi:TPA: spore coat protein U domain-containing protein [Citrobacter koseri]|uniref:Csu type fimbrial protein n=1 Tax=Citrobacter koseri TaxID=545 RepID=UPI001A18FEA4|nr:spore coat protein U domain-containing protein [Citrobacter koseri]HDQ2604860.1 spore coat protein U domain-containing protein [Citrobacter koseri]